MRAESTDLTGQTALAAMHLAADLSPPVCFETQTSPDFCAVNTSQMPLGMGLTDWGDLPPPE